MAPSQILQGTAGTYHTGEELGQGGFGVTYLATRQEDGLVVALKSLRIDRLKDWKALELFAREAEVLRKLSHPHIPAYVDYFPLGEAATPDGYVLVQEYVPGKTLRQLLREGQRLSEAEMLRWLWEILEVLAYLHQL